MADQPKYAIDYLNGIKRMKQPDRMESELARSMRGTLAGALMGGVAGLVIAQRNKSNLIWGAFLGSLAGGLVTKMFFTKS